MCTMPPSAGTCIVRRCRTTKWSTSSSPAKAPISTRPSWTRSSKSRPVSRMSRTKAVADLLAVFVTAITGEVCAKIEARTDAHQRRAPISGSALSGGFTVTFRVAGSTGSATLTAAVVQLVQRDQSPGGPPALLGASHVAGLKVLGEALVQPCRNAASRHARDHRVRELVREYAIERSRFGKRALNGHSYPRIERASRPFRRTGHVAKLLQRVEDHFDRLRRVSAQGLTNSPIRRIQEGACARRQSSFGRTVERDGERSVDTPLLCCIVAPRLQALAHAGVGRRILQRLFVEANRRIDIALFVDNLAKVGRRRREARLELQRPRHKCPGLVVASEEVRGQAGAHVQRRVARIAPQRVAEDGCRLVEVAGLQRQHTRFLRR